MICEMCVYAMLKQLLTINIPYIEVEFIVYVGNIMNCNELKQVTGHIIVCKTVIIHLIGYKWFTQRAGG